MTVSSIRRLACLVLGLAALAGLPAAAQNVARGEEIYMSICRACHGFPPSGGPDRAAGNALLIRAAINGRVPAMGFLKNVLSDQDLRDVAQWLLDPVVGPPPPPPPPPTPAIPDYDVTDLWWNPQEPGWGLNLIQHSSNVVFGVMYTYDTSRRPLWLVIPGGTWTATNRYEGDLFRVTGPAFNAATFDASRVNVVKVGTAVITFGGRDSGTFTYTVDGLRVDRPIQRQPF